MAFSRKILLVLGLFLLVRMGYFIFSPPLASVTRDGKVSLIFTLETVPRQTPKSWQFEASGYRIVARRYPELGYGDRIKIVGESKDGVVVYPTITILGSSGRLGISGIYKIRERLIEVIQRILPEPEGGLAAGILLGYKAGLDSKLNLNLQNTGLTHVVAASGTNLSLVSGLVMAVGSMIVSRRRAVIFLIPLIWFYAVICGFEAPVIRAAIMVSFSFLAMFLGRQISGFWGLAVAAYLMIVISPEVVLNLGFQLSIASMTGVLIVGEVRDVGGVGVVWGTIKQTVAAQMMTAPIILANFGVFNVFSFIINALVLWMVPYVMAISVIAGIVGIIEENVAKIIIVPVYFLLSYFVWVVDLFGKTNPGLLQGERLNVVSSIGIYLVLAGVICLFWRRR